MIVADLADDLLTLVRVGIGVFVGLFVVSTLAALSLARCTRSTGALGFVTAFISVFTVELAAVLGVWFVLGDDAEIEGLLALGCAVIAAVSLLSLLENARRPIAAPDPSPAPEPAPTSRPVLSASLFTTRGDGASDRLERERIHHLDSMP